MDYPNGINRRTHFEITDSLTTRFWRRVAKTDCNSCWLWLGAMRNGYGAIKHNRSVLSAHVVSFVIHGGSISEQGIVTHSCDNRQCVNPAHLRLGTFADNVYEMQQRRIVSAPRGEEVYNAILTDKLVREIRTRREATGHGYVKLARHFGLNKETVKNVLSRKTWNHVE